MSLRVLLLAFLCTSPLSLFGADSPTDFATTTSEDTPLTLRLKKTIDALVSSETNDAEKVTLQEQLIEIVRTAKNDANPALINWAFDTLYGAVLRHKEASLSLLIAFAHAVTTTRAYEIVSTYISESCASDVDPVLDSLAILELFRKSMGSLLYKMGSGEAPRSAFERV